MIGIATVMRVRQTLTSRPMALLAVGFALLIAAACSGSDSNAPAATATPSEPPTLNGIVAASEILVGDKRLPFGLVDFDGRFVEGANVEAQIFKLLQDGSSRSVATAEAQFREIRGTEREHQHSDGSNHVHQEVRGIYTLDGVTFTEPGIWEAHLTVTGSNVSGTERAILTFQVLEGSATFAVGDTPPPSLNPTSRDVTDLTEITTHDPPVPGLYELTVAEALEGFKPFVVVFSTPAFCVTRICGPVADVAAQVYEEYKGRVEFIHIEPWDLEKARNEGELVPTAVSVEWRLPTEPWTFVVGKDNRIAARWEGLVTPEELSAALDAALQ